MIAAIVQARMGSSRLPGKTLMDVAGRPLLGHLVDRAQRIPGLDEVIIATTTKPADNEICSFANREQLRYYRGSEDNVLDRFYQTAKQFGVSVIVRVTPDCPLFDPSVSGRVLQTFIVANQAYDYVSNTRPPTYPDGLDTEVFSFHALERAWNEAELLSDKEHVTPYIWKNGGLFNLRNVEHDGKNLSDHRWTVDEEADLTFVRAVFERLGDRAAGMNEVLSLLSREPDLRSINSAFTRNEGYARSLRDDHVASEQSGDAS